MPLVSFNAPLKTSEKLFPAATFNPFIVILDLVRFSFNRFSLIFAIPSRALKNGQPHKMVKHNQAIRWQKAGKLFACI